MSIDSQFSQIASKSCFSNPGFSNEIASYQHPIFQTLELLLPRTLWSESFLNLRTQFTLMGPPSSTPSPAPQATTLSMGAASHSKSLKPIVAVSHHNEWKKDFPIVSNMASSVSTFESALQGIRETLMQRVDINPTDRGWDPHQCKSFWSLVEIHRRYIRKKFPLGFHFGTKIRVSNDENGSWSAASPSHLPLLPPEMSGTDVVLSAHDDPRQTGEQESMDAKKMSHKGKETQKNILLKLSEGELREDFSPTGLVQVNGVEEGPTDERTHPQLIVYSRLDSENGYGYRGSGGQQKRRGKKDNVYNRGCKRIRDHPVEVSSRIGENQRVESQSSPFVKVRSDARNGRHSSSNASEFLCASNFCAPPQELWRSVSCDTVEMDNLPEGVGEESRENTSTSFIIERKRRQEDVSREEMRVGKDLGCLAGTQSLAACTVSRRLSCSAPPSVVPTDVDSDGAAGYRSDLLEPLGKRIIEKQRKDGIVGFKIYRCRQDEGSPVSNHESFSRQNHMGANKMNVMQAGMSRGVAHLLLPHGSRRAHESILVDPAAPAPRQPFDVDFSNVVNTASNYAKYRVVLSTLRTIAQVLTNVRQTHLSRCPLCFSSAASLRWCSWVSQPKCIPHKSLIKCSTPREAQREEAALGVNEDLELDEDVEPSIDLLISYRARVEHVVGLFLQHQRDRVKRLLDSRPNMYKEYSSCSLPSNSTSLRFKADHVLLRACHELGGVELLEALIIGLPKD